MIVIIAFMSMLVAVAWMADSFAVAVVKWLGLEEAEE